MVQITHDPFVANYSWCLENFTYEAVWMNNAIEEDLPSFISYSSSSFEIETSDNSFSNQTYTILLYITDGVERYDAASFDVEI